MVFEMSAFAGSDFRRILIGLIISILVSTISTRTKFDRVRSRNEKASPAGIESEGTQSRVCRHTGAGDFFGFRSEKAVLGAGRVFPIPPRS